MESESLPDISSKCWAVFDAKNGKILSSKNEKVLSQIASITKIMTACICLKYITKLKINIRQVYIVAPECTDYIEGTIAGISEGDSLTIEDLLYALLLPSGNDAAICLAGYFGNLIKQANNLKTFNGPEKIFINEMNETAKELNMSNSIFSNPHGMHNYNNKSTCEDIGKLSIYAMKYDLFRRIVSTACYSCKVKNVIGNIVNHNWKNTNRLLSQGYNGIKTGTTSTAGPCLVSSYEKNDVWIIVVLLSASTDVDRWQDAIKLTTWHYKRLLSG